MGTHEVNRRITLGFLTVVDHPQYGLFGGYLLLSTTGRPLEFHCTTPIKPNRAQQILYGPTLESFLYGEQIGRTLLEKASVEASLVCTDREAVLAVREHVSLPVALVLAADGRAPEHGDQRPHIHSEAFREVSPLPLGEGQGVRAWQNHANGIDSFASAGPHPNPLPEGEGIVASHFPDGLSDRPGHRSAEVVGSGLTTFQVGRNRLAVPAQSDGDRQQIVERLACLPESFDLAEPFGRIRAAIEEAQLAVRSPSVAAA